MHHASGVGSGVFTSFCDQLKSNKIKTWSGKYDLGGKGGETRKTVRSSTQEFLGPPQQHGNGREAKGNNKLGKDRSKTQRSRARTTALQKKQKRTKK
jgi:hypothetical protein